MPPVALGPRVIWSDLVSSDTSSSRWTRLIGEERDENNIILLYLLQWGVAVVAVARNASTSAIAEHRGTPNTILLVVFFFIFYIYCSSILLWRFVISTDFVLVVMRSYVYALSVTLFDDYNTCAAIILRILYCVRALVLYRQSYNEQ